MDIKSLPLEERPREKLIKQGPKSLTDSELLAILLGTGNKNEDVLTLSTNALKTFNLKQLSRASIPALRKNLKIGEAKACQIAACFELSKRLALTKSKYKEIKKAKDIADMLMPEMRTLNKEQLKAVFLNTRKKILRITTLFIGSLDESVIHPRDIFQAALEENAAAIILVHNHPSGDPTPSQLDIESTKQILDAGEMMSIPLLDHIIIGDNRFISMHEKGLL